MGGPLSCDPTTRHELHYGDRVVRCFADRPPHIDAMFRAAVGVNPDGVALILGERRIAYVELDRLVEHVAGNLALRGFEKGDRLALLMGNCVEFVVLVLAAARIGVIAVPMNTRQRKPETEFMLNQCRASGLVYDITLAEQIPDRAAVPSLRQTLTVGGGQQDFAALSAQAKAPERKIAEEDVFCLLYTSGTTGKPKGAMLTHFGTVHSAMHFEHGMALGAGEVSVLAVPASHVTGLVAIVLTLIRVAGTTVIMPAFKAREFLSLAARERMTHTLIVPAMYNLCLLEPDFSGYDHSCWRIGGFGGAPMPEATIARLRSALPRLCLLNCYGSTETTSPATILPVGDIATRSDSVGKAVSCADLIAVDEEGREVAPGASGELWIAGPMVVPGYWDNPDANKSAFAGGYWRSGDIGSIDEGGYVRVFDRKKDMINRGGFKVYCIEVENTLSHHPGVIECAVIGRPDPVLGERTQAFIVARDPAPDPAQLKAFCAERLSDYKIPDFITFLRTPLPRNANGKVLKTALREIAGDASSMSGRKS